MISAPSLLVMRGYTKLLSWIDKNILELAFLASASATMASLVLSNILRYVPCELCWFQRILMFPLPFIFAVALLRRDKLVYLYALPLIIPGGIIALYQSLLQWDVLTETSATCSLTNISCGEPIINWLGFLTIPFGSLLSFALLGWLMMRLRHTDGDKVRFTTSNKNLFLKLLTAIVSLTLLVIVVITSLQK